MAPALLLCVLTLNMCISKQGCLLITDSCLPSSCIFCFLFTLLLFCLRATPPKHASALPSNLHHGSALVTAQSQSSAFIIYGDKYPWCWKKGVHVCLSIWMCVCVCVCVCLEVTGCFWLVNCNHWRPRLMLEVVVRILVCVCACVCVCCVCTTITVKMRHSATTAVILLLSHFLPPIPCKTTSRWYTPWCLVTHSCLSVTCACMCYLLHVCKRLVVCVCVWSHAVLWRRCTCFMCLHVLVISRSLTGPSAPDINTQTPWWIIKKAAM